METHKALPRLAFRAGRWESGARTLPAEVPVAIVYSFFVEHYVSGLTGSVKG